MEYKFDDREYEWFKEEFHKLANLDLNKYKQDQMKRRITTYVSRRYKLTYKEFLGLISKDEQEFNAFKEYLTINVSEFFRNIDQWEVLKNEILPLLVSEHRKHIGKLRVWSSACSSGEEPYSLSMLLTKYFQGIDFEIIATDIDDCIIEKAKKATYKIDNLDKIPSEYRQWFIKNDYDTYEIADEIKKNVRFENIDLLKDSYPQDVNLLVCRNVLIYFMEDAKDEIYKKFADSLISNGILFVGSSEQIVNSIDYKLKSIKTYFYKKI